MSDNNSQNSIFKIAILFFNKVQEGVEGPTFMDNLLMLFALLFAVALTHRLKPSEHNAKVSWNLQNHALQLRDTTLPVELQLCVTELAKLRRPLIEDLAANLPPDSMDRQLLDIALQGHPDALVRFAELLPPPERVCLQAGAPLQGNGGETLCSVCGQELVEFDQDLREAAAEDDFADLAFEMAREESYGGDHGA
jgi:hypothetical protein